MAKEEKIHAAIIFADMKDFSKLPEHILPAVQRLIEEIRNTIIDRHSPIHVNTWGDGFFICLSNCEDAAEVALSIRDYIRRLKWRSMGFQSQPMFRIGLHFSNIICTNIDGSNKISGAGVNIGSRIEPIVEPGKVYCSDLFKTNLEPSDEEHRFSMHPLGVKTLAKASGEMPLFELTWTHEQAPKSSEENPSPEQSNTFIPRIPGRITDLDKRMFSDRTLHNIHLQFPKWAKEASQIDPSLHIRVKNIDVTRLSVERYRNNELEHSMLIWVGGPFSPYGINVSEGLRIDYQNTSSYNEILGLKETNGALSWESTFGRNSFFGEVDFDITAMDDHHAITYLWHRFMKNIS